MNKLKVFLPFLQIAVGLVLSITSAALAPLNLIAVTPTPAPLQITATSVQFTSKSGNTDGIVIWGTILIIIFIIAVIWHQPDWTQKEKKVSR
jgi:hypothetical protein